MLNFLSELLQTVTLFDTIGMVGAALLVLTYAALQFGRIQAGISYSALNLLAAVLLMVSLYATFNLASALIEVFWIGISLYGIYSGLMNRGDKVRAQADTLTQKRRNPSSAPHWDATLHYSYGCRVNYFGYEWLCVGSCIGVQPSLQNNRQWYCRELAEAQVA